MAALFGGAALTNALLGGDSGESGSTAGMVANEVGLAALSGELKGATTGQPHTPNATGKLHSIARQAKVLPASSGTMLSKVAQAPTQLVSSAGRVISNSVFNVAPMGGAAMLAPSMGNVSGAVSAALPVNRSVGSTLSKMGKMGGKLFRPLGALMSGAALVDAVSNGDA
ncbi:MAG: hypothetical protein OIF38_17000, partial [Cellvibrionaceae bacterium]|nr:hypothetical protein [Cellvibrionaceae bacterium]